MGGRGGKGGPGNPRNGPSAPAAPAAPALPGGGSPGGGGGGGGNPKSPGGASPGGVNNPQGGGGPGGGGGPTVTPAPPQKKWYDTVPRHGQPKEALLSDTELLRRDTAKVNPRQQEPLVGKENDAYGNDNDYKNNCTRVAATWILRTFFGWDVTAGKAPWMNKDGDPQQPGGMDWYTSNILDKWIDPATGLQRQGTYIPNKIDDPKAINGERIPTKEEWIEMTQKMILEANPEGSGGFMRITGHIFNWYIKDGEVHFIEAQPQPYAWQESYDLWDKDRYPDGSKWWQIAVYPEDANNWFLRVDDLEPQKKLFDDKWVFSLTTGEKNAPFFEDMILQAYSLYADSVDKRQAFREGWDQVRKGKRPRIPTGWKGTEKEDPYKAGLEYARNPD